MIQPKSLYQFFYALLLCLSGMTAFAQEDIQVNLVPPVKIHIIYENDRGKIGFGKDDFISEYELYKQEYFNKLGKETIERYEKALKYVKKSKSPLLVLDSLKLDGHLLSIKELIEQRLGVVLLNKGKADVWQNYGKKKLTWISSSREPSTPEGDRYTFDTDVVRGIFQGTANGVHTPEDPALKEKYKVFTRIETSASPIGGLTAYAKYISDNKKYPEQARKEGITGKVFVEFVVLIDGNLDQIKVLKGIGSGCDEEALRLISEGSKWTPAKQDKVKVKQRFVYPVPFP